MLFKKPNLNSHKLTAVYLPFSFVLALTLFLRFYQLATLTPLISDQGKDYLSAQRILSTGSLPLLGIESSVPRFRQGPLYVWFTAITLKIGKLDPYYPTLMAATFGSLAVGLTYLIAQRFFSTQAALVSSLILSTSPLAVVHSRLAFHINAIPFFSAIYLYLLFISLDKKQFLPLAALSFGLLFQFELVVFPLILLLPLTLYFTHQDLSLRYVLKIVLGLILGLLPQLIHDLTHQFRQLGLFIIWIGYRVLGLFAPDHQHSISLEKTHSTLLSVNEYLQKFTSWPFFPFALVFYLIFLVSLVFSLRTGDRKKQLLGIWLILMFSSFFILGNASEAYFPVLFVPLALQIAVFLDSIKHSFVRSLFFSFILLVCFFNSFFILKSNFILSNPSFSDSSNPFNTYGPPIVDQITAVQTISTLNQPFRLISSDPNSYLPSYLDNYRYLLAWFNLSENPTGLPIWINLHQDSPLPPNVKQLHIGSIIIGVPMQ